MAWLKYTSCTKPLHKQLMISTWSEEIWVVYPLDIGIKFWFTLDMLYIWNLVLRLGFVGQATMLKVFVRSTKIDRLTRSSQLCVLVYQNTLLSIAEEGTTTRQLTHLKLLSAQVKFIQELADLAKTKNRPHYAESTSRYIELIMQTLLAHGTNP